jgi:hypothetical protein
MPLEVSSGFGQAYEKKKLFGPKKEEVKGG